MQKLLQDGVVTNEPVAEKNWVGFMLNLALSRRHFLHALENGILSWDVFISRHLSIVLISSLCARAGDVVQSHGQSRAGFMQWGHIQVKVTQETSTDDTDPFFGMVMRVIIHYEKGHKDDPSTNREVLLRPLENPHHNVVCPVKLLLIHAMRTGHVGGSTIDEVVAHARTRKNRLVEFLDLDDPIIACIGMGRAKLNFKKAAEVWQVNMTLERMAKIGGLSFKPTSHSLRYGAARDVANLPHNTITGEATATVARALGHSMHTFNAGVTDTYVGNSTSDIYGARAQNRFEHPFDEEIAPVLASSARIRKRNITSAATVDASDASDAYDAYDASGLESQELKPLSSKKLQGYKIDDYCRQNNIDPSVRENRIFASQKLIKLRSLKVDKTVKSINVDTRNRKKLMVQKGLSTTVDNDSYSSTGEMRDDDAPINHVDVDNMTHALAGEMSDATEYQDVLDEMIMADGEVTSTVIDSSANDFMAFFASINISDNQFIQNGPKRTLADRILQSVSHGNSRDPATLFQRICKNKVHGCGYQNSQTRHVDQHELNCRFVAGNRLTYVSPDRSHRCTYPLCKAEYSAAVALRQHIKHDHEYVPKTCLDCVDGAVYDTYKGLTMHRRDKHQGWIPVACPETGCKSKMIWPTRAKLQVHLCKVHKQNTAQCKATMAAILSTVAGHGDNNEDDSDEL